MGQAQRAMSYSTAQCAWTDTASWCSQPASGRQRLLRGAEKAWLQRCWPMFFLNRLVLQLLLLNPLKHVNPADWLSSGKCRLSSVYCQ